jgi:hypothetical protein
MLAHEIDVLWAPTIIQNLFAAMGITRVKHQPEFTGVTLSEWTHQMVTGLAHRGW